MSTPAPTPETDAHWMARAIELSKGGFPAPNPHVGCVIVRSKEVVGEGFHSHAGAPHAEAMALSQAGGEVQGATAYVTLEPCNHQGRTPACSLALAAAGIKRLVYACQDPNPVAAGGAESLRSAGIAVTGGVLEKDAAFVNRQFLVSHHLARPYVTVKAAVTADGFMARPDGSSKWITSPAAREDGHRLRAERGCVLVGRATVQNDDPSLTARGVGATNQPVRCVVDPRGALSGKEKVFDEQAETLWFVAEPVSAGQTAWAGSGVTGLLDSLYRREIRGVLVEGGPTTIGRFLDSGTVDELVLYVSPKLFGSGLGWASMASQSLEDLQFCLAEVSQIGPDAKLVYRVNRDLGTSPRGP